MRGRRKDDEILIPLTLDVEDHVYEELAREAQDKGISIEQLIIGIVRKMTVEACEEHPKPFDYPRMFKNRLIGAIWHKFLCPNMHLLRETWRDGYTIENTHYNRFYLLCDACGERYILRTFREGMNR